MSVESYRLSFPVRWADLDPNRHLRHTAYNDYATHVRFSYLAEHGFDPREFARIDLGPVILREETRFLAEVRGGTTISIDFLVAAASPSWRRFSLWHNVTRQGDGGDAVLAAIVVVDGGWMDLSRRKLVAPPDGLVQAMRALPHTDEFTALDDPD